MQTTKRTFGGQTLDDLKALRKNSTDGANFYMALLDASPDLFKCAEESGVLLVLIKKLVSALEKAASEVAAQDQNPRCFGFSRNRWPIPPFKKSSRPVKPALFLRLAARSCALRLVPTPCGGGRLRICFADSKAL